ncbi:ATP-binding protein [Serratia fonticola]|uniref:ATP-binding protein n=1 Tax=Serratia fonticola TaxID=47917 RepID=UPI00217BA6E3|nr:ATP-binding protein [Serratia fonticola]CAI0953875.1 cytochrome c biogenesis protein CcmA [Serratia fonticola]CAI1086542.1 cytochrome c biogenesis protein CcmA [Serratia fonticola]
MKRLKRFNIAKFWSDRSVSIDLEKNFTILTGHNGSGKTTALELLHDSFSLIHDGQCNSLHEKWATELSFYDGSLVRSFNLGRKNKLSQENYNEMQKVAKEKIRGNLSESVKSIFDLINNNFSDAEDKEKNRNLLLKKELSSSVSESFCFTLIANMGKGEPKYPKTIFFKDDEFYYNNISEDKKSLEELDIFIKENSINKTLYLLLNEFISQESLQKAKLKSKSELKDEIKKAFLMHVDNHGSNNGLFDKKIEFNLDEVLEKVYADYIIVKEKPWGEKLFKGLNKFLETTNRTVTRDDRGFIAFQLKNEKLVRWYNLSRGEKTLLSILLSVFLYRNKDVIFILDEPDLSLHIEWQELLLPTLSEIAPRRHFIISTHSPALVGNVDENYINMTSAMD